MAWAFQEVFNVGVQIMLLVVMGWCFAHFRLLTAEQFMGQINVLILRVAFPTMTIYLLGIKVDLRDADTWKSLGAYVLWVTLVQVGIVAYTWLLKKRDLGIAGVLNLVLTANNTVIVGLPVMSATFPSVGSKLSLLTAFVLFLQVIPFSITAFEVEKWMAEDPASPKAAAGALGEPPPDPDEGRAPDEACKAQGGDPSARAPEPAAAAPGRASWSGSGAKPGRQQRSGGEGYGNDRNGDGAAPGSDSAKRTARRKGLFGRRRRRPGADVAVGAVAGDWAQGAPHDSDTSRADGMDAAADPGAGVNPAVAPVMPALPSPAAGLDRPDGLAVQPTFSHGVGVAAAAAAAVGSALLAEPSLAMELLPAAAAEAAVHPPAAPLTFVAVEAGAEEEVGSPRLGKPAVREAAPRVVGSWSAFAPAASAPAALVGTEGAAGARARQTGALAGAATAAPAPGSVAVACLDRQPSSNPPPGASLALGSSQITLAGAASAPCSLERSVPSWPSPGAAVSAAAVATPTRPAAAAAGVAATSGTPAFGMQRAQANVTPACKSGLGSADAGAGSEAGQGAARATGFVALHRRVFKSRASADRPRRYGDDAASSASAATAAAAARGENGPMGHRLSNTGRSEPGVQRQSWPVHWPPLLIDSDASVFRVDGVSTVGAAGASAVTTTTTTAAAAAAAAAGRAAGGGSTMVAVTRVSRTSGYGGGSVYDSPLPSPPLSRRLLSPVALACPDLPVPQAIGLARVTNGTVPRTSWNGGGGGGGGGPYTAGPASAAGDISGRPSAAGLYRTSTACVADPSLHGRGPSGGVEGPGPGAVVPGPGPSRAVSSVRAPREHHVAVWHWVCLQLRAHRRAWTITWIIVKNPLLWSLLVALLVNLSGLRQILFPGAKHYRPELGWVAGSLAWTSGLTVPISLFSQGVWMHGKSFGRDTMWKACWMLLLKLVVLGPLQLACAAVCGLQAEAAMSIMLLSLCPVASTSFVIAAQYGRGADMVTGVTLLGVVLLVPVVLVALALPKAFGLYDYTVSSS